MKYVNLQKGIAPVILILILGIIVAGIGVVYYFKQQQAKPASKSDVFTDQLTPEKFTQNFYNEYLTGGSPNSLIKEKFSDDLLKEMAPSFNSAAHNRILCAQDTPQSIGAVDKISATGDSASVLVHTIYSVSGDNPIKVELKSTNGNWKITKINCSPSLSEITANWKTYTNAQYEFEVKYPADTQCGQFSKNGNGGFDFGRINIAIFDSKGIALNSFVDAYLSQNSKIFDTIESKKEMNINAGNAITVAYRFGGTNRYGEMTFLKNNANIYVVGYTAGGFSCAEFKIFPQMLSTFKFTDKYQTVDLKDILKYSDSHEKNSFVKTNGKIVNLAYGNFRDFNIVLSDGNNNYILVTISHPDVVSTFSDIISTLNKDDKIEVNGLAIFTSRETLFNATEIGAGKNLLSVNQNLPDRIGAITVTGAIQKLK